MKRLRERIMKHAQWYIQRCNLAAVVDAEDLAQQAFMDLLLYNRRLLFFSMLFHDHKYLWRAVWQSFARSANALRRSMPPRSSEALPDMPDEKQDMRRRVSELICDLEALAHDPVIRAIADPFVYWENVLKTDMRARDPTIASIARACGVTRYQVGKTKRRMQHVVSKKGP